MLYLVHHGDAVSPAVDPMRPLSARGRSEAKALAEQALARGAKPAAIWHSGKLRARQTAECFWRICNPLATFSAVKGLQPDDPTEWIVDAIAAEEVEPMIVGHYPHLPRLLAHLLMPDTGAMPAAFPMNGVVALERSEGRWIERWRLDPSR